MAFAFMHKMQSLRMITKATGRFSSVPLAVLDICTIQSFSLSVLNGLPTCSLVIWGTSGVKIMLYTPYENKYRMMPPYLAQEPTAIAMGR